MKDIVERLRETNEDSLIMAVVRDCLEAAVEIEHLRKENESTSMTLRIMKQLIDKSETDDSTRKTKNPAPKMGRGKTK